MFFHSKIVTEVYQTRIYQIKHHLYIITSCVLVKLCCISHSFALPLPASYDCKTLRFYLISNTTDYFNLMQTN